MKNTEIVSNSVPMAHWVINDQLELILGERFYEFLKGKSYRSYYNQQMDAPTVALNTLSVGLLAIKEGYLRQSLTLQLEEADGKQYAMPLFGKSTLNFLNFNRSGVFFNIEDYRDTLAEKVIFNFSRLPLNFLNS